jgi:hypothetical protein
VNYRVPIQAPIKAQFAILYTPVDNLAAEKFIRWCTLLVRLPVETITLYCPFINDLESGLGSVPLLLPTKFLEVTFLVFGSMFSYLIC